MGISITSQATQADFSQIRSDTKPTTRANGTALVSGDRWYHGSTGIEFFWNGVVWVSAGAYIVAVANVGTINTTTGGFRVPNDSNYNARIEFIQAKFFAQGLLSVDSYWNLWLANGNTVLVDLEIKSGDNGATESNITKTSAASGSVITVNTNTDLNFSYRKTGSAPNGDGAIATLFYRLVAK